MAFFSLFLVYFVMFLIFLAVSTGTAIILLIVSRVLKKRDQKKQAAAAAMGDIYYKRSKAPLVTKILGFICLIPIVGTTLLICGAIITSTIHNATSLSYSVFQYDYEKTEKLLKHGVTPDCTEESNAHAENGEDTLLWILLTRDGLDRTKKDGTKPTSEDHDRMVKLLLDYGADINYKTYSAPENSSEHTGENDPEHAIYFTDDGCGRTPLLYAVQYQDLDRVKFLIENGADVNAVDFCGFNAINILADERGDEEGYEMLEYFLEQGVDPNHVTKFGQSSIWLAERNRSEHHAVDNDKILEKLYSLSNYN